MGERRAPGGDSPMASHAYNCGRIPPRYDITHTHTPQPKSSQPSARRAKKPQVIAHSHTLLVQRQPSTRRRRFGKKFTESSRKVQGKSVSFTAMRCLNPKPFTIPHLTSRWSGPTGACRHDQRSARMNPCGSQARCNEERRGADFWRRANPAHVEQETLKRTANVG